MRTFLFLAVPLLILGAILTALLWPHRAEPRTRRLLLVIWVFIGIAVPVVALIAITSVGVSALYIFDLLSELLRNAGVPKLLAQGIAAVGVLPVLLGLVFVFLRGGSKRYVGVGILSASAAAYFFTSYAFAIRHAGYVIRTDNTLGFCDSPGETDRATLKSCRAMTPEVLYVLSRARRDKAASVFDWPPPDQILTTDGKPQRWYCPRPNGSYVFAVAPVYDPITGLKCQVPTHVMIDRYREKYRTLRSSRHSNSATKLMRQDAGSPISLPFVEDFKDGKYDSIHAVGDWQLKNCEGVPCICTRDTGPVWFTFNLDNVPLHQFSIQFRISGEDWSSRVVYHPRGITVTHKWIDIDRRVRQSCVQSACVTSRYPLSSGEWHQVTFQPSYEDRRPEDRLRASELWMTSAKVEIWLGQNAKPWDNALVNGYFVLAWGRVEHTVVKYGVDPDAMLREAWKEATIPINRVTMELRQEFSNELCVAQFEIQPMMRSLGQANIQ